MTNNRGGFGNDAGNGASVCLVGVPHDAGSSFEKGAAKAPPVIRRALTTPAGNPWTETGLDLGENSRLIDHGDLFLHETADPLPAIETAAFDAASASTVPIFLGGDHLITYPILRAFLRVYPDLTVLQFDAHPDLYDNLDGNRLSHACTFARILEEHPGLRLIQTGVRCMTGHQWAQAKRFGVTVHEMVRGPALNPEALASPLYISFDMDALDPAHAPGVSHPAPGGLTTREALDILHRIRARVVGADIVECNPRRDLSGLTAHAAAKLLKETAGVILRGHPAGAVKPIYPGGA